MKLCIPLLIGAFGLCLQTGAQETIGKIPESEIALLRSDIRTKKTDIVQQNLALSEEQAKKFWPLHRSYEDELAKLGDNRFAVIQEYAKDWHDLSDQTAKDLGKRYLDYQKKRVDLQSKYFDRMSKEISPTVAAKFFQIETQMDAMIDLEIAWSLPLIK